MRKELIGWVKWFGRFRGYSFYPDGGTVYNNQCLRDIADFIDDLMKLHREHNKKLKAGRS